MRLLLLLLLHAIPSRYSLQPSKYIIMCWLCLRIDVNFVFCTDMDENGEWRIVYRSLLLIFYLLSSCFTPQFSVSFLANVLFLSANKNMVTFVHDRKVLTTEELCCFILPLYTLCSVPFDKFGSKQNFNSYVYFFELE